MSCKTILYIAMSEDGFIAGENDNIDFLNPYQVENEDYGYKEFINSVGYILVGRRTYEKVIGMGYHYHTDKIVYVATRNLRQSENENLIYYNGSLKALLTKLKASQHTNIYCDGGAELAQSLIAENLIDQITLSIIPIKLENGTLLFDKGMVPHNFSLKKKREFKTRLVQFSYELKK
jgi:dihydrofolate reductase